MASGCASPSPWTLRRVRDHQLCAQLSTVDQNAPVAGPRGPRPPLAQPPGAEHLGLEEQPAIVGGICRHGNSRSWPRSSNSFLSPGYNAAVRAASLGLGEPKCAPGGDYVGGSGRASGRDQARRDLMGSFASFNTTPRSQRHCNTSNFHASGLPCARGRLREQLLRARCRERPGRKRRTSILPKGPSDVHCALIQFSDPVTLTVTFEKKMCTGVSSALL